MKFLILILMTFTHSILLAQTSKSDSCIDISKKVSDTPVSEEVGHVKEVVSSLHYQAVFCIQNGLQKDIELYPYHKKKFPIGLKIKVSENGKFVGSCDCEDYIRSSGDIKEARYKLLVGNCYSQAVSRYTLEKNKKISPEKTFCWNGSTESGSSPSRKIKSVPGVN